MNDKIKQLDAFIAKLGISESELDKWYKNRRMSINAAEKKEEINAKFSLPLVYYKEKVLCVVKKFDSTHKNLIWGIEIAPGTVISIKKHSCCNNWNEAKNVVSMLEMGTSGRLPSRHMLEKWIDAETLIKFKETLAFLQNVGVDVDYGADRIWCREEYGSNEAYLYLLESLQSITCNKCGNNNEHRITVTFV